MSESKVEKIVFQWDNKQFVIDRDKWKAQSIPAEVVGDARVVVRRGALVANIPSDVPFGTFCICVNLATINSDAQSASSTVSASPEQRRQNEDWKQKR